MECPNCGADVPRKAKACPECGSCEETGWSEEANETALDLPEEEFDYDQYVKREFGTESLKPHGLAWIWWIVAIILLVVLALFFFFR